MSNACGINLAIDGIAGEARTDCGAARQHEEAPRQQVSTCGSKALAAVTSVKVVEIAV